MKKFTLWFLAIFFISFSITAQTNLQPTKTDFLKLEHSQKNDVGPIQYSADEFDVQFEYPCAVATGEAGVECDGNYIYTTLWNGNEICKYEMSGTFVGTFECASGLRDLAWDGTYFYGAAANTTIFEMDFDAQVIVSTFSAPVATRAIAYDNTNDAFWANNWSEPPTLFDRGGATLNSFNIIGDEQFYGFAWMSVNDWDMLWGYGQREGTSQNILFQYELPTGSLFMEFDMLSILTLPTLGEDIAGGLFSDPNITSGVWTLGGVVQNICIWGIETYFYGSTWNDDVGIRSILEPTSGVNLSSDEPITIVIKNYGYNSQTNIPFDVTWGDGYYDAIFPGTLLGGESVEITLPETVDMTEYKEYIFEACTYLDGDENTENNCKTKIVECVEPHLIIVGLYTSGCEFGDGLVYWNLANTCIPEILCDGVPFPWYHDFTDSIIYLNPGESYVLTVQAGYADTYFDVWIDYNDDYACPSNETILDDGYCPIANTDYSFTITIPDTVNPGLHFLRYRTNWQSPVNHWGATYAYGNCCDFMASVQSPGMPGIVVDPTSVWETMEMNSVATRQLTIANPGDEELTYDITLNFLTTPPTPPQLTPEEYQLALTERRAKEQPAGLSEVAPGFVPGLIQYSDEPYDLQFEYPCADATGEAGVETDGNYIYTSLWNGTQFVKYEMDGTYIYTFSCGSAAAVRDLAYDGTYFYGGAASTTIFEMDFDNHNLVSTFTAPVATRAIAYDDGEDGFWVNNWSDSPTLFDRSGTILNSFNINGDEQFYGFAYMNNHAGIALWGSSQTGSGCVLKKYDLPYGTWIEDVDMFSLLTMPVAGVDIAGGLFVQWDILQGYITLGGLIQNICIWGIEIDGYWLPDNDVQVLLITEPNSGIYLTNAEPISIVVKNNGFYPQSNIPYDVSWVGGYYSDTIAGPLNGFQSIEISLPVTVDLSAFGDYTFTACTYLDGDENPDNDCKTKIVSSLAPFLCIDGLYSSGCNFGDGLVYWDFANINIPEIECGNGDPHDWYHDFTEQEHLLAAGSVNLLTVKAGYNDNYFDVWIDFNDDLYYDSTELILNDAFCALANTEYQFQISIPDSVTMGEHLMRFRTNWQAPVEESCEMYGYGNCCDFTANIIPGGGDGWLTAYPLSGVVTTQGTDSITLLFNSMGMLPGEYLAELIINNNSWNDPELEVPVTLTVFEIIEEPIIAVFPDSLEFEVFADSIASELISISNIGIDILEFEMSVEYLDSDNFIKDSWLLVPSGPFYLNGAETIETEVVVDATGLEMGTYLANINIASNDPLTPNVNVVVTLLVIEYVENPIIYVDPDFFEFELYKDSTTTAFMEIGNFGAALLDYTISVEYLNEAGLEKDSWIGIVTMSGTVEAGEIAELQFLVSALGLEAGDYFANILVASNDPVTPLVTIPVTLTVIDGCPLPPPTNLAAEEIEPFTVFLTWDEPEDEFLFYNVYRDASMIATELLQTQYIDYNVPAGSPKYVVSAVYEECEAFSDTLTNFMVTSVNEITSPPIVLYPNPTTDILNIESTCNILKIEISNNLGQAVYQKITDVKSIQINTSFFSNGIYFVQIETSVMTVIEKLVIE